MADAARLKPNFVTYSGGGFSINLQSDYRGNKDMMEMLRKSKWIDLATRLFVIEFSVYFEDINMFHVIKLVTLSI